MFKKKVFLNCPKCHSRLNQRRNIGVIGVCTNCDWAGSYSSEHHGDWVQFKVSAIIIVFSLSMMYLIMQLGPLPQFI